jgi:hypothetical protein
MMEWMDSICVAGEFHWNDMMTGSPTACCGYRSYLNEKHINKITPKPTLNTNHPHTLETEFQKDHYVHYRKQLTGKSERKHIK